MSLAILFHFLCAQHVSDINISIIRSLRLFCWITTLVVLLLVRCVLQFRCGWVGVVSVLQLCFSLQHGYHSNPTTPKLQHTSNQEQYDQCGNSSSGACDCSVELPHWSYCSWFDVCWNFGAVGLGWYPCCRLKPATHKKWNKIASDIKLVLYSSSNGQFMWHVLLHWDLKAFIFHCNKTDHSGMLP